MEGKSHAGYWRKRARTIGSMTEQTRVERSIVASETIRKARELAWGALLVFPFLGAVIFHGLNVGLSIGAINLFGLSDLVVLLIAALLLGFLFLRLIVVAIRLGRDLRNTDFLQTQQPERFPSTYLIKRILGLSTNAA